ncbi:hypothetical protein [Streptomyces pseudogriseolus]|uniref:hypothetical protein n=1 Tax=Streptomyces pseudogriseolus TaxID=36817 RepID=UPI001CE3045A|nr:hypothetical protein [Streptomyces pseudogriseolus]
MHADRAHALNHAGTRERAHLPQDDGGSVSDSRIVRVVCRLTAAAVTVGVTDEGGGGAAVVPGVLGVEREGGRGLLITDALAERWGTLRAGGYLTVRAEVGVDRSA